MAILYGTQSNGETLPVLVDQFGNLRAKGIDGQPGPEGPPGPPGVGELPPDPFEGAVLGWEDGELSWLGGSVPLPAGTYGPYTYSANEGKLDIPQDAAVLVNGQQLFMSDEYGHQISIDYQTDAIASVGSATNYAANTVLVGYSVGSGSPADIYDGLTGPGHVFAWSTGGAQPPSTFPLSKRLEIPVPINAGDTVTITIVHTQSEFFVSRDGNTLDKTLPAVGTEYEADISDVFATQGTSGWCVGSGNNSSISMIKVNGEVVRDNSKVLTFATTNNFEKFEVGDVVQGNDVDQDNDVIITAFDYSVPSITVDGGTWRGTDGSGTGVETVLTTTWSGQGSVLSGFDGAIFLRDDNQRWVDGFWVTAPEQAIAARKVAANARKLRKK